MKKYAVLVLLVLVSGMLFGAGKKSDKEYVQNLTEEEIMNGEGYTRGSSITRTSNNKTTIKVKRFSGFENIMELSPNHQNVELLVTSEVSSGGLRLVVCDKESILYEFEIGEKDQSFKLPSTKGDYVLKAAGKNANYTLEVEVKVVKTELPSFEGTVL